MEKWWGEKPDDAMSAIYGPLSSSSIFMAQMAYGTGRDYCNNNWVHCLYKIDIY